MDENIEGNIIIISKNWDKKRPVIVAKSSKTGAIYYFGVTHSKKDNCTKLTQNGITGLEVDKNSYFSLSNIPKIIEKQIGTITQDKADEMINVLAEKTRRKIEKQQKKD